MKMIIRFFIFSVGVCLFSSMSHAALPGPSTTESQQFFAELRRPTDANVESLKRHGHRFCNTQEQGTGLTPLQVMYVCYPTASPEAKELYKDLFRYYAMKLGASLNFEPGDLVADLDQVEDLSAIGREVVQAWTAAVQAVRDKDCAALTPLIADIPYFLSRCGPIGNNESGTLLHVAAEQWDSSDQASVQMLAYLLRSGAAYDTVDNAGQTVAALMADGTHKASKAFKKELGALASNSSSILSSFSRQGVSTTLSSAWNSLKGYKKYSVPAVVVLGGFLWLCSGSSSDDLTLPTAPLGQLE